MDGLNYELATLVLIEDWRCWGHIHRLDETKWRELMQMTSKIFWATGWLSWAGATRMLLCDTPIHFPLGISSHFWHRRTKKCRCVVRVQTYQSVHLLHSTRRGNSKSSKCDERWVGNTTRYPPVETNLAVPYCWSWWKTGQFPTRGAAPGLLIKLWDKGKVTPRDLCGHAWRNINPKAFHFIFNYRDFPPDLTHHHPQKTSRIHSLLQCPRRSEP